MFLGSWNCGNSYKQVSYTCIHGNQQDILLQGLQALCHGNFLIGWHEIGWFLPPIAYDNLLHHCYLLFFTLPHWVRMSRRASIHFLVTFSIFGFTDIGPPAWTQLAISCWQFHPWPTNQLRALLRHVTQQNSAVEQHVKHHVRMLFRDLTEKQWKCVIMQPRDHDPLRYMFIW